MIYVRIMDSAAGLEWGPHQNECQIFLLSLPRELLEGGRRVAIDHRLLRWQLDLQVTQGCPHNTSDREIVLGCFFASIIGTAMEVSYNS